MLIAGLATGCTTSSETRAENGSSTAGDPPASSAPGDSTANALTDQRTIATGLDVPWGLAFLPDGSALVSERDEARILRIPKGGRPIPVGDIPDAAPSNEAGVMGVAVSPQFASDSRVFVYYSTNEDNRVVRYKLDGDRLQQEKVIVTGIPVGAIHDGGRIAFGPDGWLYIGTGDAGERPRSQDRASLGGKILRVDQDGNPPTDNPWPDSPVWSMGHRNVQGLAWDSQGRMYATEFGQDTWDELNLIRRGGNYGWPEVEGRSDRTEFINPLTQWKPSEASPSGLAIGRDGAAYVAALGGRAVIRVELKDGRAGAQQRLLDDALGRVRTVANAPDGRLWVISSNTFRGAARDGDDRIVSYDVAD